MPWVRLASQGAPMNPTHSPSSVGDHVPLGRDRRVGDGLHLGGGLARDGAGHQRRRRARRSGRPGTRPGRRGARARPGAWSAGGTQGVSRNGTSPGARPGAGASWAGAPPGPARRRRPAAGAERGWTKPGRRWRVAAGRRRLPGPTRGARSPPATVRAGGPAAAPWPAPPVPGSVSVIGQTLPAPRRPGLQQVGRGHRNRSPHMGGA